MHTLDKLPRWPRLLWTLALAPAVLLLCWRRDSCALLPAEDELFTLLGWWDRLTGRKNNKNSQKRH